MVTDQEVEMEAFVQLKLTVQEFDVIRNALAERKATLADSLPGIPAGKLKSDLKVELARVTEVLTKVA